MAWVPSAFAAAFCVGLSGSRMRLPDAARGAQLAAGVAATPQREGDEAEAKILEMVG